MNELCFFSNITSAEWAAWVQAVGSVLAIIAAAWIAIHQSNLQHKNSIDLHKIQKLTEQTDITRTLSVLAVNSSKAMKHISIQLNDREAVHKAAEGLVHCDIGEMVRIDTYLSDIPLHTLPHSMVTQTMILGSTVRQFKEKIEMALQLHRKMDADMFKEFFQTTQEMNASIETTCIEIAAVAKRLETSM